MIRIFVSSLQREFAGERAARFKFGENLRLADSQGRSRTVRLVEVLGRSTLIEYGPHRTEGDAG